MGCKLLCRDPVTYSERGHRFAGDYCDAHGRAVHSLRRGSPCACRHCTARDVIRQTQRVRDAAAAVAEEQAAVSEALAQEVSDAD